MSELGMVPAVSAIQWLRTHRRCHRPVLGGPGLKLTSLPLMEAGLFHFSLINCLGNMYVSKSFLFHNGPIRWFFPIDVSVQLRIEAASYGSITTRTPWWSSHPWYPGGLTECETAFLPGLVTNLKNGLFATLLFDIEWLRQLCLFSHVLLHIHKYIIYIYYTYNYILT